MDADVDSAGSVDGRTGTGPVLWRVGPDQKHAFRTDAGFHDVFTDYRFVVLVLIFVRVFRGGCHYRQC